MTRSAKGPPIRRLKPPRGLVPVVAAMACVAGCAARPAVPPASGAHLMDLVSNQVALGPRVPGTPAHERGLEWISSRLAERGARVSRQTFDDTVPGFGVAHLTNLVASFPPADTAAGAPRLLFAAHWDCRPWCDRDPDTTQWRQALPGANDSGSGVAVLLALAEAFSRARPASGVDLVFLDGEDLGTQRHPEGFFRGSKRFAALPHPKYSMGVLLDMVGGRGARFTREPNSMEQAPEVTRRLWERAARLKLAPPFDEDIGPSVGDDHLALNAAGIPTADIIDLSYPEWHTSADLPAAMDSTGLQACYRLLAAFAYSRR